MKLGYKAALRWLLENDDCSWLDGTDAEGRGAPIAAWLLADIYGQSIGKVALDMLKARVKGGAS